VTPGRNGRAQTLRLEQRATRHRVALTQHGWGGRGPSWQADRL